MYTRLNMATAAAKAKAKAKPKPAVTEAASLSNGARSGLQTASGNLPLNQITPCPFNPRKHFDQAALDELAASMTAQGLIEPIVVREVAAKYEILAGERRWRAAKQIGWTEIGAQIRYEVTDEMAIEIMLTENGQRAPLTPLEEARAFDWLFKQHLKTPKEIADRQGIKEKTVHRRLALLKLNLAAQKALDEGKLSYGAAVALARMSDDQQREAATKGVLNGYGGRVMNEAQTKGWIERNYILDLNKAGWSPKDETLVPAAGPCTTCIHRSGNNPDLFDDLSGVNLCTNTPCFDKKRAAHNARKLADAQKKLGAKVMPAAEAKKVLSYGSLTYNAPFVEAEKLCNMGGNKKDWKKIVAGDLQPLVAQDENGDVHLLYPKKEAEKLAIAKLGLTNVKPSGGVTSPDAENRKMKEKAERLAGLEFLRQVMASAALLCPDPADEKHATLLREYCLERAGHIYHDTVKLICAALGIEKPERKKDKNGYAPNTDWHKLLKDSLKDSKLAACYAVVIAESAWAEKGSLYSYQAKKTSVLLATLAVDFNKLKAAEMQKLKDAAKPKAKPPAKEVTAKKAAAKKERAK